MQIMRVEALDCGMKTLSYYQLRFTNTIFILSLDKKRAYRQAGARAREGIKIACK